MAKRRIGTKTAGNVFRPATGKVQVPGPVVDKLIELAEAENKELRARISKGDFAKLQKVAEAVRILARIERCSRPPLDILFAGATSPQHVEASRLSAAHMAASLIGVDVSDILRGNVRNPIRAHLGAVLKCDDRFVLILAECEHGVRVLEQYGEQAVLRFGEECDGWIKNPTPASDQEIALFLVGLLGAPAPGIQEKAAALIADLVGAEIRFA
jgi:hypothetical protein